MFRFFVFLFHRISTIVTEALQDSVSRILSPKTNFDLLYDIKKTREQGKVYSIVFCGVNGVGKSTSLSKIAYHLKSKGYKVWAALRVCDCVVDDCRLWYLPFWCRWAAQNPCEETGHWVVRKRYEILSFLECLGYSKDPADVCHLALKYVSIWLSDR